MSLVEEDCLRDKSMIRCFLCDMFFSFLVIQEEKVVINSYSKTLIELPRPNNRKALIFLKRGKKKKKNSSQQMGLIYMAK